MSFTMDIIRCIFGDYDANRCRFSKEQPHTLDYGMDFYAPQTTELPDGRRIMIAWMKSWDACVIPNSQDWQGMMTFPRGGDKRKPYLAESGERTGKLSSRIHVAMNTQKSKARQCLQE